MSDDETIPCTIPEFTALPSTSAVNPPLDTRVSWIYPLRKEELETELARFNLDTKGTVDEQRKRLVKFIKEGRRSPLPMYTAPTYTPIPFPSVVTAPVNVTYSLPNTSASVPGSFPTVTASVYPPATSMFSPATPTVTHPLKVHRWGISFDGKGDPASFLERLEEVMLAEGVTPQRMLPCIPQILKGGAALWYRNNRNVCKSWNDFVREFQNFYYPVNYHEELEIEISRRLQKPNEPVANYITELQAMMRRHGTMSEAQMLSWLYRNLLPEFRRQVRRTDFNDISSFTKAVRDFETLNAEINQCKLAESIPKPREANRIRPGGMEKPSRIQISSTPGLRQEPVSTKVQKSNAGSVPRNSEMLCWRCGQKGHFRQQCRNQPKLFCSRCRREGIMTRDCQCSGNDRSGLQ